MYYLEFWATYWKELADATTGTTAPEKSPSEKPVAEASPVHSGINVDTVSFTEPEPEMGSTPPSYANIDAAPCPGIEVEAFPPPAHPFAKADSEDFSPKEKYEYLTEYGTQILSMFSAQAGCTYLSRNFEALTGWQPDTFLGEAFYDIVHDDFRERIKETIAAPATEAAPMPLRCKLKHADGKYYWHLFLIHPKTDGEFVCIIEDIHDSVQTQHTLQKARLEAELALRARSEFLANMSHDLRTPLNAVIGFSQLIESQMFGQIQNPQYMDYIRHIHESGYDLLSKIEDLLEISSLDAGRVTLNREEVHIGEIMKHVLDAQAHHASAAKVLLESPPSPDMDLLLHVDRLKMQHILGHLVSNAIKFSAAGGRITMQAQQSADGKLHIRVNDTGSGMTTDKLDAIIAALREDNYWSSHENKSLGLGLALTREFVALHGGQVSIDSRPGDGTTIEITLPKDCVRGLVAQQPEHKLHLVAL